jgi:hypothetical protein
LHQIARRFVDEQARAFQVFAERPALEVFDDADAGVGSA